jgi:His-Xaa-Ser system protein HxsD
MSELAVGTEDGAIRIELDESLYPKQAIYGAAYVFIDRCYVKLERTGDKKVAALLKPKAEVELSAESAAGEFQNELLSQAWRQMILDDNRDLIEQVTTQALAGAAGPVGLDDLLDMEIGDETAFEDPLGIAMSWEDKYKPKGDAEAGSEDTNETTTTTTTAAAGDAASEEAQG